VEKEKLKALHRAGLRGVMISRWRQRGNRGGLAARFPIEGVGVVLVKFFLSRDPTQNWLILRNGTITIGLFQGAFERNTFTFNPGWTAECEALETFTDVREIQKNLKAKGLSLASEADESATGPASLMLIDPDGNPVLIDQHIDSPPT